MPPHPPYCRRGRTRARLRWVACSNSPLPPQNPLYLSTVADVLGVPLLLPREDEAVLVGTACLAAVAGGAHSSVEQAMEAMTAVGGRIEPGVGSRNFHEKKYAVYRKMVEAQQAYRDMMK